MPNVLCWNCFETIEVAEVTNDNLAVCPACGTSFVVMGTVSIPVRNPGETAREYSRRANSEIRLAGYKRRLDVREQDRRERRRAAIAKKFRVVERLKRELLADFTTEKLAEYTTRLANLVALCQTTDSDLLPPDWEARLGGQADNEA